MTKGNEPAFPVLNESIGLTKREWFAGIIAQGFVGRDIRISSFGFEKEFLDLYSEIAKRSVKQADILLEELENAKEVKE